MLEIIFESESGQFIYKSHFDISSERIKRAADDSQVHE